MPRLRRHREDRPCPGQLAGGDTADPDMRRRKYRNPENPVETWAGRGLKPRWLTGAIKGGKNIEDFAIAGATTSSKANGRKKARKARK